MQPHNLQDVHQVFQFIIELDRLKAVLRKNKPVGLSRYENSAEHSWQVAVLALTMAQYSSQTIATEKVVEMLLLHDVVEIDAGDKILYSQSHADYEKEHAAAVRILSLLPAPLAGRFLDIWEEFAQNKTPEAQFANGIDRLIPVLQNLRNSGQSWVENNIRLEQVLEKNELIGQVNPAVWKIVRDQIIDLFESPALVESK